MIIALVALVASIIVLVSLGDSLAFLSVFVSDALWASVLLSIVLVVVNISGAIQSRETIKEMQKARKAEFLPHIRVQLTWLTSTALMLKATNFGKGPAINIVAEIIYSHDNKKSWVDSIFAEKETLRIFLPDSRMDVIPAQFPEIKITGQYEDIFAQKYPISETIDTKQFIDETIALQPALENNQVAQAMVKNFIISQATLAP
ncbi:hypothetical protein IMZ68_01180 [Candidatus Bathyarchaeota archaeon]|nr:hypothetical protein [Candidatus Bathyarchaeota archaeon]